MTITKTQQPRGSGWWCSLRLHFVPHHCGWGFFVLAGVFFCLALLANVNFETRPKMYVEGQVAEQDVRADRSLQLEDSKGTEARRDQALQLQPLVYDIDPDAYTRLHNTLLEVFRELNDLQPNAHVAAVTQLTDILTPGIAEDILMQMARPEVQAFVLEQVLPTLRDALNEGLVADVRAARLSKAGVVIRHPVTGTEIVRSDMTSLPDLQSTLLLLNNRLRQEKQLPVQSQKAIAVLVSALATPSLTLNREATRARAEAVVENVSPIYYHVQRGEVVLRRGERVSRDQQIKLQAIYNAAAERVHWQSMLGVFALTLFLSLGFFVAPSGRVGKPIHCKDHLFMALVLTAFTVGAKLVYLLALHTGDAQTVTALAYAFPVAGGVGLVAMVFAAQRYCALGLLLSLFVTLMFRGDMGLFFYYFLSGMVATWLVTRAHNRQDVVWSVIPLAIGQCILWLAASMFAQTPFAYMPIQIVNVLAGALLSLLLLFAFSPILEMAFGYTTRFRLMELMSLEQPLMQELMMTMPGTYHHSLVVANMVEAGAKAIGANSLLCKVAALYHDAGKLQHPEYFIENQYGGPNKHDKLSPSMSTLILNAHVKKGVELAQANKLGQEIEDIIRQHHGTRCMRYFYQKALDAGETPHESDYCYPGPRPQTREAAVVMLADAVEASSRTLNDPTPARIKNHIDSIIKGIFSEGQLDESELTFKDLHKLSETFLRILTGMFHQRVAYPDAKKPDTAKNGVKAAETPASVPPPVSPIAPPLARPATVS